MADTFTPGTRVQLMENGEWTGEYIVTRHTGRTPDHLVLRTPNGSSYFEVYNDAPFNIRELPTR